MKAKEKRVTIMVSESSKEKVKKISYKRKETMRDVVDKMVAKETV